MRIDLPYQLSDNDSFQRLIALLTNASYADVAIVGRRPGSTIYYFYIGGSQGNAQSIYLYDQYLSHNDVFSNIGLPTILSYYVVAPEGNDDDGDSARTLYIDGSAPDPIVPPQPSADFNYVIEVVANLNPAAALSANAPFWLFSILFCLVIQLLIQ